MPQHNNAISGLAYSYSVLIENDPIMTHLNVTYAMRFKVDVDVKLKQALAGGTTKASVENELLGDLEQSGGYIKKPKVQCGNTVQF